jgi:ABC-type uncharacterized transport system auxiliary subunit
MKNLLIVATAIIALASCTPNARARNFGGTETIELPANRILVNCTWKETNLWILTKDTLTNKMYFNERSSLGVMEGEINFK